MTRGISANINTEAQASTNRPVLLVKLEYDSGDVLVNSTTRSIVFNAQTYLGIGNFGNISQIDEDTELRAMGIELTLSGVQASLISQALTEDYQGRDATIWLGYVDSNLDLVDGDSGPFIIFKGRMDTQKINVGGEAKIILSVESRFVDWNRPRVSRYNNETQQLLFPGDKGLEFAEQTTEKTLFWGVVGT